MEEKVQHLTSNINWTLPSWDLCINLVTVDRIFLSKYYTRSCRQHRSQSCSDGALLYIIVASLSQIVWPFGLVMLIYLLFSILHALSRDSVRFRWWNLFVLEWYCRLSMRNRFWSLWRFWPVGASFSAKWLRCCFMTKAWLEVDFWLHSSHNSITIIPA